MSEAREHKCDKMKFTDVTIKTIPITYTMWCLCIEKFNITIYQIKYCPYCGVELKNV